MNNNLFHLPDNLPPDEVFEAIIPDSGILIERIGSRVCFSAGFLVGRGPG